MLLDVLTLLQILNISSVLCCLPGNKYKFHSTYPEEIQIHLHLICIVA